MLQPTPDCPPASAGQAFLAGLHTPSAAPSDTIARFIAACVRVTPGTSVPARALYVAFRSWAAENDVFPMHETRFGREMRRRFQRSDGDVRAWLGIALRDGPEPPAAVTTEALAAAVRAKQEALAALNRAQIALDDLLARLGGISA
ncbi:viral D5 protein-like [Roseiarcus fermentans]|uniref:Viral D5 protein-like n=1 Tax=Roseiarcus fermentans TaxID=1473586 RepID=A0A366EGB4_9HYPH|nr:primase-like DNA-binding domain-containing protein [Roseiarcus fermentans]RBP01056.1 viral D5 protein-like [Roseiarcus fermentans]